MFEDLSILDLLLAPIYFLGVIAYGFWKTRKNIKKHEEYKYFIPGLIAHMLGSIALGLLYFFYYDGGDTVNYFESAVAFSNLIAKSPDEIWIILEGDPAIVSSLFDESTGYTVYNGRDSNAFFIVKLLIPIVNLSFHSYFTSAVLVACITYGGLWKLYQTFLSEFPELKKQLAIAVLFIPSCLFWGSGIMKDSFALSAVGWFTYGFYNFFIKKSRKSRYALFVVMAAFIILAVKPYIFFALLPGSVIWLTNNNIKKLSSNILRVIIAPIILLIGSVIIYYSLNYFGDNLGQYKLDKILDKAVITQRDMKSDYYGGKTFDIGNFDASIGSILSVAPKAIFSGIFRPGLWDVKNVQMLMSGLENSYILILTIFLLFKLKLFGFFVLIRKHPMIVFCMLFSLFFAFSVGLTVSNFGSLVRLRIPELPFFVGGIFMLRHVYEKQSGTKVNF